MFFYFPVTLIALKCAHAHSKPKRARSAQPRRPPTREAPACRACAPIGELALHRVPHASRRARARALARSLFCLQVGTDRYLVADPAIQCWVTTEHKAMAAASICIFLVYSLLGPLVLFYNTRNRARKREEYRRRHELRMQDAGVNVPETFT